MELIKVTERRRKKFLYFQQARLHPYTIIMNKLINLLLFSYDFVQPSLANYHQDFLLLTLTSTRENEINDLLYHNTCPP